MVCNDSDTDIDLVIAGHVVYSGHIAHSISYELNGINIKDGIYSLENAGESLKAHSCIDVRMSQSRI